MRFPSLGTRLARHPQATTLTRRGMLGVSLLATLLVAACGSELASSPLASATAASGNPGSAPPGMRPAATAPTSVPVVAATPTNAGAPVATTAVLTPTDSNVDPEDVTPPETEGPYFKPNSPERSSLVGPGVTGTRLTLSGRVLSTSAQPVARALLDFWQADAQGSYDNVGYALRGHQFADAAGRYQLVTVIPGLYPGRTRHIHVKVQAPSQPILTTQLYFPGEPRNSADSLFNSKLVMAMQNGSDGGEVATFNFVLNVG